MRGAADEEDIGWVGRFATRWSEPTHRWFRENATVVLSPQVEISRRGSGSGERRYPGGGRVESVGAAENTYGICTICLTDLPAITAERKSAPPNATLTAEAKEGSVAETMRSEPGSIAPSVSTMNSTRTRQGTPARHNESG